MSPKVLGVARVLREAQRASQGAAERQGIGIYNENGPMAHFLFLAAAHARDGAPD